MAQNRVSLPRVCSGVLTSWPFAVSWLRGGAGRPADGLAVGPGPALPGRSVRGGPALPTRGNCSPACHGICPARHDSPLPGHSFCPVLICSSNSVTCDHAEVCGRQGGIGRSVQWFPVLGTVGMILVVTVTQCHY